MSVMTHTETIFKKYLENHDMPHIFVDQSVDSHCRSTGNQIKRPDFLVAIRNIGMIAVDVKERRPSAKGDYIADSAEMEKYDNFQKQFMIPVWFCFISPVEHYHTWCWIPLSDVMRSPVRVSGNEKKPFYCVSPHDTIPIHPEYDALTRLVEPRKKHPALSFATCVFR